MPERDIIPVCGRWYLVLAPNGHPFVTLSSREQFYRYPGIHGDGWRVVEVVPVERVSPPRMESRQKVERLRDQIERMEDDALAAHEKAMASVRAEVERLRELLAECHPKLTSAGLQQDITRLLGWEKDWRCECGDLNRAGEAFCYRCGAGQPEDDECPQTGPMETNERTP